jgi:3D (Asp-Asp-Asp) domain-containing protein
MMPAESIKASKVTGIADPGYSGRNSNYCLLPPASVVIEAAILQMPKCLNLTLAGILACLFVGCATQSKPSLVNRQHMQNVRTTAYTHSERGGPHNALGSKLSGCHVMSAASDWSRFPLGTRFRIANTNEEYIIDDYGIALVGTDTIDLYKTSRLDMQRWGVRHVDIDILQWGSEEESLKVLTPRCKHHCVRQMVIALEKKRGKTVAQASSNRPSL